MKTETRPYRPLAEITDEAIDVLTRELGAADTIRFLNQFSTGFGDYTKERVELLKDVTLDDIFGPAESFPSEEGSR